MDAILQKLAVIILAAGKGSRMKSESAKVLHELKGVPMIYYVIKTAIAVAPDHVYVVIGHQADAVRKVILRRFKVDFVIQSKQFGTGHAVQCALPHLDETVEQLSSCAEMCRCWQPKRFDPCYTAIARSSATLPFWRFTSICRQVMVV